MFVGDGIVELVCLVFYGELGWYDFLLVCFVEEGGYCC